MEKLSRRFYLLGSFDKIYLAKRKKIKSMTFYVPWYKEKRPKTKASKCVFETYIFITFFIFQTFFLNIYSYFFYELE